MSISQPPVKIRFLPVNDSRNLVHIGQKFSTKNRRNLSMDYNQNQGGSYIQKINIGHNNPSVPFNNQQLLSRLSSDQGSFRGKAKHNQQSGTYKTTDHHTTRLPSVSQCLQHQILPKHKGLLYEYIHLAQQPKTKKQKLKKLENELDHLYQDAQTKLYYMPSTHRIPNVQYQTVDHTISKHSKVFNAGEEGLQTNKDNIGVNNPAGVMLMSQNASFENLMNAIYPNPLKITTHNSREIRNKLIKDQIQQRMELSRFYSRIKIKPNNQSSDIVISSKVQTYATNLDIKPKIRILNEDLQATEEDTTPEQKDQNTGEHNTTYGEQNTQTNVLLSNTVEVNDDTYIQEEEIIVDGNDVQYKYDDPSFTQNQLLVKGLDTTVFQYDLEDTTSSHNPNKSFVSHLQIKKFKTHRLSRAKVQGSKQSLTGLTSNILSPYREYANESQNSMKYDHQGDQGSIIKAIGIRASLKFRGLEFEDQCQEFSQITTKNFQISLPNSTKKRNGHKSNMSTNMGQIMKKPMYLKVLSRQRLNSRGAAIGSINNIISDGGTLSKITSYQ